MALLHEDELLPHPLDFLFQVCSDDGQVIQDFPESLDFDFQVFLEGVFVFIPLVGRKEKRVLLVGRLWSL